MNESRLIKKFKIMLAGYKNEDRVNYYAFFERPKQFPPLNLKEGQADPKVLQDILRNQNYPNDYRFICFVYHSLGDRADETRKCSSACSKSDNC